MQNKKERFFKKALETLPKLQKEDLIRLSEILISERSLFYQLIEHNPTGVIVYQTTNIIFQCQLVTALLKECPNIILSPTQIGTFSIQDIYGNERVLEISHENLEDELNIYYITDVTTYQKEVLSQKTRKGLDALETLAAGIAHEIKNPLSAIDIHTQLIKRQIDKKTIAVPNEIEEYIQIVQHENSRLLLVLDDFLNMTRKIKPKLVFTEISDILYHVEKVFEQEFYKHNIIFKTNIAQVPKIFTSPSQLQQAISDLIRNAIEAIEKKDQKIILLSLTEDYMKNNIIISVEDSGNGISPSIRNRVFEPYFTTKKTGTGLGLTLVNKMIHEIGGFVIISNSDELGGASCQICLPISKGQKKLFHKK